MKPPRKPRLALLAATAAVLTALPGAGSPRPAHAQGQGGFAPSLDDPPPRTPRAPEAARAEAASGGAGEGPRLALSLLGRVGLLGDEAYGAFGGEDQARAGGLGLTYDVAPLGERGALAVGAGVLAESLGDSGSGIDARLDVLTLFAEAQLRLRVRWWLEPHLRVTAGANRGRVSLGHPGAALEGDAWGAVGSAGAGLTLLARPWRMGPGGSGRALQVGVSLEGGLVAGQPLDFTLRAAGGEDEGLAAIPRVDVPIGELPRTFPYVGVQVGLRL